VLFVAQMSEIVMFLYAQMKYILVLKTYLHIVSIPTRCSAC